MNITFVHDLDTGFLSRTLKPHMQALGHHVQVIQTMITQIEGTNSDHIDIHTGAIKDETGYKAVHKVFEETDLFIIRSISDTALRVLHVFKYAKHDNAIWKVHGTELRELGHPYSLMGWRTLQRPLVVVGNRDPSLIPLYRENTITHINKPVAFETFPRKRKPTQPFALHTPTNYHRKGTHHILDKFTKTGTLELLILSGVPREEILQHKAQASFFIDHTGTYKHGPYGVNSVEAWFYMLPTWSNIRPIDRVFCPELEYLSHPFDIDTVSHEMNTYEPDRKQLRKAKAYALRVHDPRTIAQQYVHLGESLEQ